MSSYLYIRAKNYTGQTAIGQDWYVEGSPQILEVYGHPFKNNVPGVGANPIITFRARNATQYLDSDDSADTGAAFDSDKVRILHLDWVGSAGATQTPFNLTAGILTKPTPPTPPRASVTVDWLLRNDEASAIVFHDLYFVCFELNGEPNEDLKRVVRAFLRHQSDPQNFPLTLALIGTAGSVTFDPVWGTMTLEANSEARFTASFILEHPGWYAYPVVSARVGRIGTPENARVEFIQMFG